MCVETTNVNEGVQIVPPADPVKSDDGETYYIFSQWADESGNAPGVMGTADVRFDAVFTSGTYIYAASVSGKDTLRVGKSITLTGTLTATPDKDVSACTPAWNSGSPTIATVDASTGVVSGVSAGSAVIRVY